MLAGNCAAPQPAYPGSMHSIWNKAFLQQLMEGGKPTQGMPTGPLPAPFSPPAAASGAVVTGGSKVKKVSSGGASGAAARDEGNHIVAAAAASGLMKAAKEGRPKQTASAAGAAGTGKKKELLASAAAGESVLPVLPAATSPTVATAAAGEEAPAIALAPLAASPSADVMDLKRKRLMVACRCYACMRAELRCGHKQPYVLCDVCISGLPVRWGTYPY